MEYMEAMDIIGGLSNPSKMPWFSWSISAFDCITGTKLRDVPNSVCSSCYACKGNYRFSNVKNAHARRLEALSDPRFKDAFIVVLTKLYERTKAVYTRNGVTIKENRFRWHDSGDLQSVDHLKIISEIAKATPFIDHWVPTREAGIVSEFLKTEKPPKNLLIRISATMVGQSFTKNPQGLPYSTVGVTDDPKVSQCPAYSQDGKCKDCRQCWDFNSNVNYPLH